MRFKFCEEGLENVLRVYLRTRHGTHNEKDGIQYGTIKHQKAKNELFQVTPNFGNYLYKLTV